MIDGDNVPCSQTYACFPYCLKCGRLNLGRLSCSSIQKIGRSKFNCYVLGFPCTPALQANCILSYVVDNWCGRCCTLPISDPEFIPGSVWWADPGWTPSGHQSCSITPLYLDKGEKNTKKILWVKIRTVRDHSPITVTSKIGSTWGN